MSTIITKTCSKSEEKRIEAAVLFTAVDLPRGSKSMQQNNVRNSLKNLLPPSTSLVKNKKSGENNPHQQNLRLNINEILIKSKYSRTKTASYLMKVQRIII